jgi:hypothetical protein
VRVRTLAVAVGCGQQSEMESVVATVAADFALLPATWAEATALLRPTPPPATDAATPVLQDPADGAGVPPAPDDDDDDNDRHDTSRDGQGRAGAVPGPLLPRGEEEVFAADSDSDTDTSSAPRPPIPSRAERIRMRRDAEVRSHATCLCVGIMWPEWPGSSVGA